MPQGSAQHSNKVSPQRSLTFWHGFLLGGGEPINKCPKLFPPLNGGDVKWCDWQGARQLLFESLEDSNGFILQGEGFS